MGGLLVFGIGVVIIFAIYCVWEAQATFARIKIWGDSITDPVDKKPFIVLAIKADEPVDLTD